MTHPNLLPSLEQAALPKQMPDGALVSTLTVDQIEQLAIRFSLEARSIEITALENGILPERYLRNFGTFSLKEQITLLQSTVAVVGLGGLGGHVTQHLARAGVGHLNLIDGDRFEDHNLNRQIYCTQDRLGLSKARTAAERICQTNTSLSVQAYRDFLTSENAKQFLNGSHAVVDCLDNMSSRFTLQTAAQQANIPLISAAVAGLCGHITTVFPGDPGLELIYGSKQQRSADRGAETDLGCLTQAVGLIAAAESAEVIKVLLGQPTLQNKMLMMDIATNTFEIMALV